MGILNKLWSKVWNEEEAKKRAEAEKVLSAAHIQAAEIRAKKTPVQEMADKHGGAEDSYYNQVNQSQYTTQQQQAVYKSMLSQAGTSTTGLPSWFNQTAPCSGGSAGGYAGLAGLGVGGGTATGSIPSTHIYQASGSLSWPVLGNTDRDIFFMALKGIEEAAMSAKNKADNYRYDDHALAIQDMRYFDPQRVSLLGLTSFCLSNLMEVEPLVVLLEGHGMVIIDE